MLSFGTVQLTYVQQQINAYLHTACYRCVSWPTYTYTYTHTHTHTRVQNIQIKTRKLKINKGSQISVPQLCQMKSSSQNSNPLKKAKKFIL